MRSLSMAWVMCLLACVNVKPVTNMPLPDVIKRRAQLTDFSMYQDHLDDLAGHVLYVSKSADGKCPTGRVYPADRVSRRSYVKAGAKLETKALSRSVYEARVSRGASDDASFVFGVFNFTGATAVEYLITDSMEVDAAKVLDNNALDSLAAQALPAGTCARLVVRGAVLSLVNYKQYQNAKSSFGVASGAANISGQVYEEASRFQPDFLIGLEVSPLEAAEGGASGMKALTISSGPPFVIRLPASGRLEPID